MKQELREPAIYNSAITAIADGASRLNQISDKTGNDTAKSTIAFLKSILDYHNTQNSLSKYLSKMANYKHPRIEDFFAIPPPSEK